MALEIFMAALAAYASAAPVAQRVVQADVSGASLAQLCRVERDLELDPCNSYILGAADGLAIGNEICPPIQGWTLIAPRVVRKFMRDNPTALSTSGGIIVYRALVAQYPCRRR